MWPLSTVTDPNRLSSASARSESSVPQPQSWYTVQSGTCANNTTGVLDASGFTSFSSQASCSTPSEPNPPALRLSTFTRPTKWTPLWSKLYQPPPLVPLPYRCRYDAPLSPATSCSPGTYNTRSVRRPFSTSFAVSNSLGLASCVMSPVCSTNAGVCGSALTRATACCSVAVTSLLASLLKPMWLSLTCAKKMLLRCDSVRSGSRFNAYDVGIPAFNPQTMPVQAQVMQRRKPRRSTPSPSSPGASSMCRA